MIDDLLKAVCFGVCLIWVVMCIATYLAYLPTTVALFNNKKKLFLGLPCTLIAWPYVLLAVIKGTY